MSSGSLFDLFSQAMFVVISMVVVIIGPGLITGLIVAVFQAATQINEQTLSFLPRLLVTLMMLVFAGPWLIQKVIDLTMTIFTSIPQMVS